MTELLSIAQLSERLRSKAASPVEVTRACLERIERLNPSLNAFITVTAEAALAQARAAEAEIQRGEWRGPLHGVPIALKDLIDTAGVRTTAASLLFADRVPQEDAEVVRRLKAAGAVILGKLNLHEFAYGGSSVISHFGPVRNPWDTKHITGGSSGGSAAAVAAGLCYGALGTDTAGSIRLPAACCGIVGLKPSYGLVSARGVVPLAWSYDHVGPMTRTVADAAAMLQAIAGFDSRDPTSVELATADYAVTETSVASLRVGVAREFFFAELDREVERRVDDAIAVLADLGAVVSEVKIPVDNDRTVSGCESWVYHERWVAASPESYDPETLRRIKTGAEVTAAAYVQKRLELEGMRRSIRASFPDVDVVVTPTIPIAAPTFAELEAKPGELRRQELILLRNTRPFNVLGLPTISVPCGLTSANMPVGLQISGRYGDESMVLRVAQAYERAKPFAVCNI